MNWPPMPPDFWARFAVWEQTRPHTPAAPIVFDHIPRARPGGYRDHGAVDHRRHVTYPPPPKGPGPRPVNVPE